MSADQLPNFNMDVYFQFKASMDHMSLVAPSDFPGKMFIENLLELKEYDCLLQTLQFHYPLLEFLGRYERHLLDSKFKLMDRIEQANHLCFVPISEALFIVKFQDKVTVPYFPNFDRKSRLTDYLEMKLWSEGAGVLFSGRNYENVFELFYRHARTHLPDKVEVKRNAIRLRFTNTAEMMTLLQYFFSFVLSVYQLWKLAAIVDYSNKRGETGIYDGSEVRNIYRRSNPQSSEITSIQGENIYFTSTIDYSETLNMFMPRLQGKLISKAVHSAGIRLLLGAHKQRQIRSSERLCKYLCFSL